MKQTKKEYLKPSIMVQLMEIEAILGGASDTPPENINDEISNNEQLSKPGGGMFDWDFTDRDSEFGSSNLWDD